MAIYEKRIRLDLYRISTIHIIVIALIILVIVECTLERIVDLYQNQRATKSEFDVMAVCVGCRVD